VRVRIKAEQIADVAPVLMPALRSVIAKAFADRSKCWYARYHRDAVLEYVGSAIGASLPTPAC